MSDDTTHKAQASKRKKADWAKRFLALIRTGSPLLHACHQLGIARSTAYTRIRDEPEFKTQYEEAVEYQRDALAKEAFRRAHDGVDEPVFFHGEVCGHVKRYSDSLLMRLLQAKDPQYRDQSKTMLSGDPDNPIHHQHSGAIIILPAKDIDDDDDDETEETEDPAAGGAAT